VRKGRHPRRKNRNTPVFLIKGGGKRGRGFSLSSRCEGGKKTARTSSSLFVGERNRKKKILRSQGGEICLSPIPVLPSRRKRKRKSERQPSERGPALPSSSRRKGEGKEGRPVNSALGKAAAVHHPF